MGKSAAAELLAAEGVAVVDTDVIAREVVNKGERGLEAVAAEFGQKVIRSDGGLDRQALAAIVFENPEARLRLEAILHPLIRERWRKVAGDWRATGKKAGVGVIPLL